MKRELGITDFQNVFEEVPFSDPPKSCKGGRGCTNEQFCQFAEILMNEAGYELNTPGSSSLRSQVKRTGTCEHPQALRMKELCSQLVGEDGGNGQ